jgi:hypothetical protein
MVRPLAKRPTTVPDSDAGAADARLAAHHFRVERDSRQRRHAFIVVPQFDSPVEYRPLRRPMPEISRFLGIVIGMFFREHGVPHFHAVYGEYKITVEIDSRKVRGEFPQELLENWERARQRHPLEPIAPLE